MTDTARKAIRLSPPMLELLTDIATKPQMYVRRYSRWGKTATALVNKGLATVQTLEGAQDEVRITDEGRAEATRLGITAEAQP